MKGSTPPLLNILLIVISPRYIHRMQFEENCILERDRNNLLQSRMFAAFSECVIECFLERENFISLR